jgi:hypothetical protein
MYPVQTENLPIRVKGIVFARSKCKQFCAKDNIRICDGICGYSQQIYGIGSRGWKLQARRYLTVLAVERYEVMASAALRL